MIIYCFNYLNITGLSCPKRPKPQLLPAALEPYISSCVALAQEKLRHFSSLAEIAAREKDLNRYPRLERLAEPRQILVLDEHDGRPERTGPGPGRGGPGRNSLRTCRRG